MECRPGVLVWRPSAVKPKGAWFREDRTSRNSGLAEKPHQASQILTSGYSCRWLDKSETHQERRVGTIQAILGS
jgi:hypothetical protein